MERVDVVVIGSGYGGAIPAARLAEAGMSVVVLERGERMATRDLRQTDDPRYIQRVVDVFVSSSNVAFRTGKLVGGASIPMDGAHFRIPQKSFEARDSKGRRYWPEAYSRAVLDPIYERVEGMLRVRQFPWTEIPKAGGLFAKMLAAVDASCDRARMNYTDCLQCGFCATGCIFDKKMTLLHTYIPLAEDHGAEFRAGCTAREIEKVGTQWVVRYLRGGVLQEISADRLFLAGGGIYTPAMLLANRSRLGTLSPHVGEHFNHNGELQFMGILPPEFEGISEYQCYKGMDNAGMMTFHWYDSEGFTLHPGGGIEPTIFASSVASADHPMLPRRAWGMEFKRWVESVYPHRVIGFSSLGLADSHSAVTLRSDGFTPDVVARDRTSYDAYLDRLEGTVAEISRRTGIAIVPGYPRRYAGMTSAHLLSSCRMSDRPEDGVVDPNGQVWGQENLFICDASALPYALGVNPALNISMLAERTVDHILGRI
jgi:choline dehydrogenase-like flavoprotein